MPTNGTSTTGYYDSGTPNTNVTGVYLPIEFRKKFGKLLTDIIEKELE